jgi:hypothetical protein
MSAEPASFTAVQKRDFRSQLNCCDRSASRALSAVVPHDRWANRKAPRLPAGGVGGIEERESGRATRSSSQRSARSGSRGWAKIALRLPGLGDVSCRPTGHAPSKTQQLVRNLCREALRHQGVCKRAAGRISWEPITCTLSIHSAEVSPRRDGFSVQTTIRQFGYRRVSGTAGQWSFGLVHGKSVRGSRLRRKNITGVFEYPIR